MAPGVLCVEKRTQGKGGLRVGTDGKARPKGRCSLRGNLWVKNGRNAKEEIGKRDFDLLKKIKIVLEHEN